MFIRYALLGCLLEHPDYGYNLKNRLAGITISDFGINDNQLYPALKKLEKENLIKKEIIYQKGSPNRNMYEITNQGKTHFLEWLESSEGEERVFRYEFIKKDDFILRCIYIQHLEKNKAIQKVENHIRLVEKTLSDYTYALKRMKEKGIKPVKLKILEFGLRNQKSRLAWLNDFINFIKTDSGSIKP